MRAKLLFLALFLICRRIEGQISSTPAAAQCSQNISTNSPDSNVVVKATALNCCFEHGLCEYTQGCVDDKMEHWNAMNEGYASVRQKQGREVDVYSILESPWVNFSMPSCIEFTYSRGRPYRLQMFLVILNDTQPCLGEDSDSDNDAENKNHTITFSVQSLIGKILFRVRGSAAASNVSPPKLYYVTVFEGSCEHDGESTASPAKPRHTPEQCKHVFDTTTSFPVSTETMAPGDDIENNAAAIAGVIVIVVVVLIVVIIIGIIVYRRKRHRSKSDDTEDQSTPAGGTNTGNTATERRGNPFSRRDGDYTDIDLATTPSSDINPYELADDDTNANGSLGPNMQRLNGTKGLEDDYSRIDEAQPTAAHSREKNTTPVKPNPSDVYSVVNKPGKKTPTPEYSLAKIVGDKPTLPNPNDVYSVVNKKGKKFDAVAKAGQPDAEYKTISHNGNSSQKVSGGATPDTYNRIGAVPSIGLNEKGRATTKPEDGLLTDDYNKLNLAGNGSVKEKSGAARAAYDHVRNDPDDAYSKARIGKRNVVIDSDYHRLKP